jgi:hypothetical protein
MMGRRRLLWLLLLLLTLLLLPSMAAAARNKRGRTTDDPPKQPENPCAEVPAVCRTNVNGARRIGPQINTMGQRVRGLDKGKRKPKRERGEVANDAARTASNNDIPSELEHAAGAPPAAPTPSDPVVARPPAASVPLGGPVAPPRVRSTARAAAATNRRRRGTRLEDQLHDFDPSSNAASKHYWSLTIGATGTHCPRGWLNLLHNYMEHFDLRGAVALEKGSKNAILHVQGVMEAACAPSNDGKELLKAHVKHFLGWDVTPQQVKMTFHPLGEGQTVEHMLGYVQKDRGKPHYALLSHNVTDAELQAGIKAYNEVAGDYRLNKVIITKKGFVARLWSYWHANFWPFMMPVDVIALCMIRSGAYVADAAWTSSPVGRANEYSRDAAWWVMSTRPSRATLEQVRVVFWAWNVVPDGKKWRYFSSARDFGETLTRLEVAVADVWYEHTTEYDIMCTVCFEMRKVLQQQHIDFERYDLTDAAFLRLFPGVYNSVLDSGQFQLPQLPAHTRPFVREGAAHEEAIEGPDDGDDLEWEGEG